MNIIKAFGATLLPLLVLDGIWLGTMSKFFYSKQLGSLMAKNPMWIAAVAFYLAYTIAVAYFIVAPAVAGSIPWWQVLLRGAFFGFVAYATYDLTNQATIQGWPVLVTVVDLAWGTFLTAVASIVAYFILK
jgi:uncharacterized membrane protein